MIRICAMYNKFDNNMWWTIWFTCMWSCWSESTTRAESLHRSDRSDRDRRSHPMGRTEVDDAQVRPTAWTVMGTTRGTHQRRRRSLASQFSQLILVRTIDHGHLAIWPNDECIHQQTYVKYAPCVTTLNAFEIVMSYVLYQIHTSSTALNEHGWMTRVTRCRK